MIVLASSSSHESADGKIGLEFPADIEGKLEKMTDPPPLSTFKVCQLQLRLTLFYCDAKNDQKLSKIQSHRHPSNL